MPHRYIQPSREAAKQNSSSYLLAQSAMKQAAHALLDWLREEPTNIDDLSDTEYRLICENVTNGRERVTRLIQTARAELKADRELERKLNAEPYPRMYVSPLGSDGLDLGA
jgi:hypothetical protein